MVTSLHLEVYKSNYEADTDLLSNAKTSGISLIGKTWLVHPSGHKYGLHYSSFQSEFPASICLCFTGWPLSLYAFQRSLGQGEEGRQHARARCFMAKAAQCVWHWFLDVISWRIWSLSCTKRLNALRQPVELAEECSFLWGYRQTFETPRIVWIKVRENWVSFTCSWKLYLLWIYFVGK